MAHQQNVEGRKIAVVSLSTNNWPAMLAHVETIAAALEGAIPGTFRAVECGRFRRH